MVATTVRFIVGNTYQYIEPCHASLDRSGRYRKVHDWVCYVDFHDNVDIVASVSFGHPSFHPQEFRHYSPIKVRKVDRTSSNHWRFHTRQQTYAPTLCQITVHGSGDSILHFNYQIRLYDFEESMRRYFVESNPQELGPVPLPKCNFGVKFGILEGKNENPDAVVHSIMNEKPDNVNIRNMTEQHALVRRIQNEWKMTSDSSNLCHQVHSGNTKLELVSPTLLGNDGIEKIEAMLQGLQNVPSIEGNKSMPIYVNVEVEDISIQQLCNICQNFIKYEAVLDSIITSCESVGNCCKSNKLVIPGATNRTRHYNLASCKTIFELCDMMNPSQDSYFKLNLQHIQTGSQSVVEFRQYPANAPKEEVLNWTRLCIWLVHNSTRLGPPRCFKESRTAQGESFDMLFEYVIKDRYLRSFFNDRRHILQRTTHDEYDRGEVSSSALIQTRHKKRQRFS